MGDSPDKELGLQNVAGGAAAVVTYESSGAALKQIGDAFDYWSSQVSLTSLQMCYALIAANWLVFGSVGKILRYKSAEWSLIVVLATIAFNMVSAYALAEWMRYRFGAAEKNRVAWEEEYQREKDVPSVWPYTKGIERAGIIIRFVRAFLPLVGGGLLIYAAIVQQLRH